MNAARAQELIWDFVRFRKNAALGWPDRSLYLDSELRYFEMLERERLSGRLEIQGPIVDLESFEVSAPSTPPES